MSRSSWMKGNFVDLENAIQFNLDHGNYKQVITQFLVALARRDKPMRAKLHGPLFWRQSSSALVCKYHAIHPGRCTQVRFSSSPLSLARSPAIGSFRNNPCHAFWTTVDASTFGYALSLISTSRALQYTHQSTFEPEKQAYE